MQHTRRERAGWLALVVVALVPLAFAVRILVTGLPGNPAVVQRLTGLSWDQIQAQQPGVGRLITLLSRHEAVALLGWGWMLLWTALSGYRTGSRWLWIGWWAVPVLIVALMVTGRAGGGTLRPVFLGIGLLSVVGLVLCAPAHRSR